MSKQSLQISRIIYSVRGQRIIFDRDLASLYGVETRSLLQAVRRNRKRFPADFIFQLNEQELETWRSQFVISNPGLTKGLRRRPYAFTEQGIAMLSSVLKSERAISVNVHIMRTFVKIRALIGSRKELSKRFDELEAKVGNHDRDIEAIFSAIRQILSVPAEPSKRRIGFEARLQSKRD